MFLINNSGSGSLYCNFLEVMTKIGDLSYPKESTKYFHKYKATAITISKRCSILFYEHVYLPFELKTNIGVSKMSELRM